MNGIIPISRLEMFMAAASGEYDGELPTPVVRLEYYLKKIAERVAADNIQPDWNQTDSTADDYIKNKPTEGIASAIADAVDDYLDEEGLGNLGTLAEFKSYVMGE